MAESIVFNEDCMIGMARYPDKYFDLAVVDPPYGIGMDNQKVRTKPNRPNTYLRRGQDQYVGGGWDDSPPTKEYFNALFRISKNQIVWGANYFNDLLPSGMGWIYWDKQMGDNNFSSGEFAYQSIFIKSSAFSYPSMRVNGTRIHPTQKPVQLYSWIYKNYLPEGGRVIDTHLGSGSNRIAADKARNIDFVGFEIDRDYFEAQEKRWKQYKAQLTLF
jgi:site-specific DNA-methyltransferase (adenine-specific)